MDALKKKILWWLLEDLHIFEIFKNMCEREGCQSVSGNHCSTTFTSLTESIGRYESKEEYPRHGYMRIK